MDKKQALTLGFKTYDDYKGCRNGHLPTVRYISTGHCKFCIAHKKKPVDSFNVVVPVAVRDAFTIMATSLGCTINSRPPEPEPQQAPGVIAQDHPSVKLLRELQAKHPGYEPPKPEYR